MDTAGLRGGAGRVESKGIERARAALRAADLAVLVVPPGATPAERSTWAAEASEVPLVVVRGKADVGSEGGASFDIAVSGQTGEGVDALRAQLLLRLWGGAQVEAVALTSERHADALRRAAEALERAELAHTHSTLEVVAGEVGLAAAALGEITGESASEAMLDAIFRRFCVGK
jgi:tRNA modification GTPase